MAACDVSQPVFASSRILGRELAKMQKTGPAPLRDDCASAWQAMDLPKLTVEKLRRYIKTAPQLANSPMPVFRPQ